VSNIESQEEIGRAFYIADDNITFFKINIVPSIIDTNTTIKLNERQILMPNELNSQGIAVLEDIQFLTDGSKIYKNVGFGVCINPKTPFQIDLPRDIPGDKIILFDTEKSELNKVDWDRVKSITKEHIRTINVEYEIYKKLPQDALIVPIKIIALDLIEAKIIANEEIERFYYAEDKDKSWIKKFIKTRLGGKRVNQLSSAKLEYCKQSKVSNQFILVFKVM